MKKTADKNQVKADANVELKLIGSQTIDSDTLENSPAPIVDKSVKEEVKTSNAKVDAKAKTKADKAKKTSNKDKSAKEEVTTEKKKPVLVTKKKTDTKVKEEKKPTENEVRNGMFPATLTVKGIKFTRCELKIPEGKDSYVFDLFNVYNGLNGDTQSLVLAFNWGEEFLAPKGKKGKGASDYQANTGIVPPEKFPADLDMSIVDIILSNVAEQIVGHSLYTEYPGVVDFEMLKKRTKEGWFDCNNCPFEVYVADFAECKDEDALNGFVNLYNATDK